MYYYIFYILFSTIIIVTTLWWLENARRTLLWFINDDIELWTEAYDPPWSNSLASAAAKYKICAEKGFYRNYLIVKAYSGMFAVSISYIVYIFIGLVLALIWPITLSLVIVFGTVYFLKYQKKKSKEAKIISLEEQIKILTTKLEEAKDNKQ